MEQTLNEQLLGHLFQDINGGRISINDATKVINTHIADVIEGLNEVPSINFSSGNMRFRFGRFVVVINFDANDDFKMIYIYENTECVAAFNSFTMGISHLFHLMIEGS